MHNKEEIPSKGRYIVRLAGNRAKEIIKPGKKANENIIPVGLTISFPEELYPPGIKINQEVGIKVIGLKNIAHAIEAGPYLIEKGEIILNMDEEGWTHVNSIRTQAARLDYTDIRGPKIAAGIDNHGNIFVLTINGRIRESVGATHFDMVYIMKQLGMVSPMVFDPGANATPVPTLTPTETSPPTGIFIVGDVNGDNVIDIVDALLIAQYYVGIINILPGCNKTPKPIGQVPKQWHESNGYETHTEAGIGGKVFKVTNLKNSGSGSLRAAVEASGPRLIVFEVGGVIDLGGNRLVISNDNIIDVPNGVKERQAWLDSLEDKIAVDRDIDPTRLYKLVGSADSDRYAP